MCDANLNACRVIRGQIHGEDSTLPLLEFNRISRIAHVPVGEIERETERQTDKEIVRDTRAIKVNGVKQPTLETHTYTHTHIHTYTHTHIHTYTNTHTHTNIYKYTYTSNT